MKHQKNSNRIEAAEADYLYTSESQIEGAGMGLFSAIDIYKDEIVAVFKGEILSDQEAEIRAKAGEDRYFISLLDGSVMDSMNVNCFAKYANDAKGSKTSEFKNNCKIGLDEKDKVCILATKNIKANQELFCSYGKRYWKKHGKS